MNSNDDQTPQRLDPNSNPNNTLKVKQNTIKFSFISESKNNDAEIDKGDHVNDNQPSGGNSHLQPWFIEEKYGYIKPK